MIEETEVQRNTLVERLRGSLASSNKKLLVASASFFMGVGLGAIGRATDRHEISAVPFVMDLYGGNITVNYIPYGLGVTLNYLPEIYSALMR